MSLISVGYENKMYLLNTKTLKNVLKLDFLHIQNSLWFYFYNDSGFLLQIRFYCALLHSEEVIKFIVHFCYHF